MTKELKHRFLSSEKSFMIREQNKIVLVTSSFINQEEAVKFIEQKYDTKVLKVNSLITNGKTKIRRRIKVTLPDKKKFYMTVSSLEKFEKVEQKNAKTV
jgi:ribosomal protein L23